MIEHQLAIEIAAPADRVWAYVADMANWAAAMPGYRSFEVIDEMNSRWTLKVGVAALVRTVNVLVRIDRWEGPGLVEFTYRLDNDPVDGAGRYTARELPGGATEVVLDVTINGQGPMAPAWEAMARPLLPKLAMGFVQTLKSRIEEQQATQADKERVSDEKSRQRPAGSWASAILARLSRLLGMVLRAKRSWPASVRVFRE